MIKSSIDAPLASIAYPIPIHFEAAVAMLKLFGNEDRLRLLHQISEKAYTVGELEQLTGITQPALSQQLGVLRRHQVVTTRRDGKFIWYQLDDVRARQLLETLHQLFCQPDAYATGDAQPE